MGTVVFAFVIGFLFAFAIFVPSFEWLLHRHTMHTEKTWWLFKDLYRLHDQTHHIAYDYNEHYTKPEAAMRQAPSLMEGLSFNGWFMVGIVGIHGVFYLLGLLPFAFFIDWKILVITLFGALAGSGAFGFLQIKFHYWYHADDGFGYKTLARLPIAGQYFLYMCKHHRLHHEDTSNNLNTLVPTVDLAISWLRRLFGFTLRATP